MRPLGSLVAVLALAGGATAAAATARQLPVKPKAPLRTTLSEAQWKTWWGSAAFDANGVTLASLPPASAGETHSALVTTKRTWRDLTIAFDVTTLKQLRLGTAPNVWEVGWAMFRFRDPENYYWFMVKTNGFELGKKQGSDTQIFLATGDLPAATVGVPQHVQIRAEGARIRVSVDGVEIVDFTDPKPLLEPGSVGLSEEDARVRFESLSMG